MIVGRTTKSATTPRYISTSLQAAQYTR